LDFCDVLIATGLLLVAHQQQLENPTPPPCLALLMMKMVLVIHELLLSACRKAETEAHPAVVLKRQVDQGRIASQAVARLKTRRLKEAHLQINR
jgi:hypothetical protein